MFMRTISGALAIAIGILALVHGVGAAEDDLIPKQFSKEQRANIQRFLQDHDKPKEYVPSNAKIIGAPPGGAEKLPENKPDQVVKQYLVQMTPHRSVPGQEAVKRVDVYYYRPNPEKGKPGITVKHTLDVTTGKEVGQTEVILNGRTPLSREELAEAVDLAKQKSEAVQALYQKYKDAVKWQHLQLTVNRKHESLEPGDRAVDLTFLVAVAKDQAEPTPVRVIVDLTKGVVMPEKR